MRKRKEKEPNNINKLIKPMRRIRKEEEKEKNVKLYFILIFFFKIDEKGIEFSKKKLLTDIRFCCVHNKLRAMEIPQALHIEKEAWTPENGFLTSTEKKNRPVRKRKGKETKRKKKKQKKIRTKKKNRKNGKNNKKNEEYKIEK